MPSLFRTELETLPGSDVSNCPELALSLVVLVVDRNEIHDSIACPVPTSKFISDHVQRLREGDCVDGDFLGSCIEDDLVVTLFVKLDVGTRLHGSEWSACSGNEIS